MLDSWIHELKVEDLIEFLKKVCNLCVVGTSQEDSLTSRVQYQDSLKFLQTARLILVKIQNLTIGWMSDMPKYQKELDLVTKKIVYDEILEYLAGICLKLLEQDLLQTEFWEICSLISLVVSGCTEVSDPLLLNMLRKIKPFVRDQMSIIEIWNKILEKLKNNNEAHQLSLELIEDIAVKQCENLTHVIKNVLLSRIPHISQTDL